VATGFLAQIDSEFEDRHTHGGSKVVALRQHIDDLENQLRNALARNEELEHDAADAVVRASDLEREFINERELRRALQDVSEDDTLLQALERAIIRHTDVMREERTRADAEKLRHEEAMREERARAEAATIRHERAILELVARHRQRIAERLDHVEDQNRAMFERITATIQEMWSTRGTTRPSLDKEHWLLLAREDTDELDGGKTVTFKIHSGQKAYIDRIGRTKDVVLANPAVNGIDVRQTVKKRMRDMLDGETVRPQCSPFLRVHCYYKMSRISTSRLSSSLARTSTKSAVFSPSFLSRLTLLSPRQTHPSSTYSGRKRARIFNQPLI
jgi:hypothetical protein